MSQLVEFYRGTGRDGAGRLLEDVWAWNDRQLEECHDFIQWLFPLPEPSYYNPLAPLLTPEDISLFQKEENLRIRLRRSWERMLTFLGLEVTAEGEVIRGANFSTRAPEIWRMPTHNWLRITRILRSLTLLGLEREARAFFKLLDQFFILREYPIPSRTYHFWSGAIVR